MLIECETKFFSCKFSFDLSVARMQKISRKGLEKGGLKEKPQNTCIIKYNELRQTQERILFFILL